ncbi:MAG: radical SAM protein, partial [Clostridia bacterium]|nr:radical SAM protein [Clostridia bacterium]
NGLTYLICGEKSAHKLTGLIDSVSISLNATNKEDYLKTVRPKFGIISYDAMLAFASDCVNFVPEVVMTVVDKVTTKEDQELSRKICEEIGVTLRVRPYEEN